MSRGKIIGFALLFLLAAVGLLWPLASSLSSSGATSTSDSVSVTQYTGDFNVAADGNMSANEALNALFQVVVTGSSGSLIPPIPAIRRSAGAHKSPPSQGTGHFGKTPGVRQMGVSSSGGRGECLRVGCGLIVGYFVTGFGSGVGGRGFVVWW